MNKYVRPASRGHLTRTARPPHLQHRNTLLEDHHHAPTSTLYIPLVAVGRGLGSFLRIILLLACLLLKRPTLGQLSGSQTQCQRALLQMLLHASRP